MRFRTEIRVHASVKTNSDPCGHHLFLMCSPERWEASPRFYRPVNTEPSPHARAHVQGAGITSAVISTHCLPSSVLDTPRTLHNFSDSLLIRTFMIFTLQIRTGVQKLQSLGQIRQLSVLVNSVPWEHRHACSFVRCLWLLLCCSGSGESLLWRPFR